MSTITCSHRHRAWNKMTRIWNQATQYSQYLKTCNLKVLGIRHKFWRTFRCLQISESRFTPSVMVLMWHDLLSSIKRTLFSNACSKHVTRRTHRYLQSILRLQGRLGMELQLWRNEPMQIRQTECHKKLLLYKAHVSTFTTNQSIRAAMTWLEH